MTAVSNTSPLNYLVLIDLQDILPVLFDRVLIPAAVRRELEAHAAPEPIRRWMAAGASWLETQPVSGVSVELEQQLGAGEREAIHWQKSPRLPSFTLTRRRRAESLAIADLPCQERWVFSTSARAGVCSTSPPRSIGWNDDVSRITSPASPRPGTTLGSTGCSSVFGSQGSARGLTLLAAPSRSPASHLTAG